MWGGSNNGALRNNAVVTAGMTSDTGMGGSMNPLFSSLLPWVLAFEPLLPPWFACTTLKTSCFSGS